MQRRLVLSLALGALLAAFAWHCATHSVDFPIYHRAATQILNGDFELYPREVYEGQPAPGHGFRYAPAIGFLFAPLALLPLVPAALLFVVLKGGALVYMMRVVARRLQAPGVGWLLLGVVAVAGGYLIEEFRNGNFHLFAIALVVFALDRAEDGKAAAPGAALAVAIASKLTPAVVLGYWLLQRRFRPFLATLCALVALWALPAIVTGPAMNNHLTAGFARYAVEKVDENDNFSVRGVLVRYLTQRPPDPRYPDASLVDLPQEAVTTIWLVVVLAGALVTVRAIRHPTAGPAMAPVEWALLLMAMLLASPHSQRPYFSMTCVPAAVLLALYPWPPARWPFMVRAGLVVSAAVGTVLPLILTTRRAAITYQMASPYFIGAVALTLALLYVRTGTNQVAVAAGSPAKAIS